MSTLDVMHLGGWSDQYGAEVYKKCHVLGVLGEVSDGWKIYRYSLILMEINGNEKHHLFVESQAVNASALPLR